MHLKTYQRVVAALRDYPADQAATYCSFAIMAELGGVFSVFQAYTDGRIAMKPEYVDLVGRQLSKTLFYIVSLASEFGLDLETIAMQALDELAIGHEQVSSINTGGQREYSDGQQADNLCDPEVLETPASGNEDASNAVSEPLQQPSDTD